MPNVYCPVIDRLPQKERLRLLDRGVTRSLSKAQPLFFAGERADRVYVVSDGVFKLCASDANGVETILGLAAEGELMGVTDSLDGTRTHDAIAASASEVLVLDAGLFLEIALSHTASATELLRAAATRERWMSNTTLERSTGRVPVRLAGRLLDLAEICGRMNKGTIEMELPLAQEDLGRLAGMCRESTCKALRRFKKAGVVDYRGRRLRILRPDVLEELRCGERA